MSYAAGTGQIELDLTGRRDPYYPPSYVRTTPPTEMETTTALILGVGLITLMAVAIWKAPKGGWGWGPAYYAPQPALRIRLNKKRRTSRRKRRTSRRR